MHCGHQFEAGGSDDPERALGANQQLVDARPAIVLLEAGEAIVDTAVRKHGLKPLDQASHGAEAQYLGAAGVGRDEAADRRRALGAERQRKTQAVPGRRLVELLENDPGLGHRAPGRWVEAADPVHPAEREDQGRAVGRRGRAADHRGVAALGHQRHAELAGEAHRLGHLGGGRQLEDCGAVAGPAAAPVGQPRRDFGRVGEHRALAEAGGERVDQLPLGRGHRPSLPLPRNAAQA
jgi:hypothetical protein